MEKLILPAINFAILIGFLTFKLKTPFMQFIQDRHKTITEGLSRSKLQAAEAESKKKEIDAKLSSIELEKQKIIAEWKEIELQQIHQLQEGTKNVLAAMKLEAERNRKALEESIRSETIRSIGRLILVQANEKIAKGLNPEVHKRINGQFAKELGFAKTSMTESLGA
jgi:F-type H+-transporting ATPase subunit b